ncbi:hypothetical protein LCGC14_0786470 [marine sediment metagenome]|uniref:Uncharacterized protein n=1 Tax=marine sediment metagenome TaxID=412755 RepID=A0A0F9T110_9ZZZZ
MEKILLFSYLNELIIVVTELKYYDNDKIMLEACLKHYSKNSKKIKKNN